MRIIDMTIRGAALLAAALACSSCGLESYEYLYAPAEFSSGTTLIIKHNTTNKDSGSFLGYQFYYKIYCNNDSSTVPSAAGTDSATIEANWSTIYPDVIVKRMTDAGYVTMVSSRDYSNPSVIFPKTEPLLRIETGELAKSITATLDLKSGEWYKTVDSTVTETYYLRRRAKSGTSSEYIGFSDLEYSSDDCDPSSASGTKFWIRVYAVAYGFSSDWSPFFSTPIIATSSNFNYETVYLGSAD